MVDRVSYTKYFKWFILILFISAYVPLFSQTPFNKSLEYKVKAAILKNFSVASIYSNRGEVVDSFFPLDNRLNRSPLNFLSLPGFGYLPYEIEVQISGLNLEYPDEGWKLYEVNFPRNDQNKLVNDWDNFQWYRKGTKEYIWNFGNFQRLFYLKNGVIGISEKNEIKFIFGFPFNHYIAPDFKLNRSQPNTYLPFLNLKLHYQNVDSIRFSRIEGRILVFSVFSKGKDRLIEYECYVDLKSPDNLELKRISPVVYAELDETELNFFKPKKDFGFKDLEDKKRYLLNALMKNIYMYRMLHLDSLEERLNIDTSTWHFREGPSDLDSLLPNYDEYLAEFKLLKFGCCWDDLKPWRCFDDLPDVKYPIYEPVNRPDRYRLVVGFTSTAQPNIEFYKFYKNTKEILIRRSGKLTESQRSFGNPWCEIEIPYSLGYEQGKPSLFRYDLYYHPSLKSNFDERFLKPCNQYAPPPPLEPVEERVYFERICPPHEPTPTHNFIRQPVDHYLLALDVETREVYFISGKDMYLSRATALYRYGESPQEPRDISEWELPEKLVYIQDRLYRYRVDRIKEGNIILNDGTKIVLELEGEEYGKKLKLRVTYYEEKPEILDVEIIED